MAKIDLNNEWLLKYEDLWYGVEKYGKVVDSSEGWLPANLPCDVHMPLIENGIIKEPLEGDNSFDCEWTEDKSWWFKKVFYVDEESLLKDTAELVFESIDAYSDIFLNGSHLGHHISAFYPFSASVKEYLKAGENTLVVRATSGLECCSDQDAARFKKNVSGESVYNRSDYRRAFVRRPQYSIGWDWGPRVVTCGIVRDAYINFHDTVSIRNVYSFTKSISHGAEVGFTVEVDNLHEFITKDTEVTVEMQYEGKTVLTLKKEDVLRSGTNYIDMEGTLEDAKLWWPNGMGEQNLYTVKVYASCGNVNVEYPAYKFGIKTVRLNQDRINEKEKLFAIEINGIRTFCKGGNWIPADSIYARISDEKYDTLIKEARNANFNMLRIWGGGFYERDIFFQKCDEYGIMVWHDFMFSTALYPDDHEWFRQEAEKELDYQTRRLRNHTSLVLWCGNNECHQAYEGWWKGDKTPSFFGGGYCYNYLMPAMVRKNCPQIPYWNSSPYGGNIPGSSDVGDIHFWHEAMMNPDMNLRISPENYDTTTSKFISEYGYVGPCKKSSILKYLGGAPIDPDSRVWQIHNNTFEKHTVAAGITRHYIDADKLDIDGYLLYAGLCQGLMYSYSLEAYRFKEYCSGGLFWMYNDTWGETGWTIIDYYLTRKISYYFVKRAFAPVKFILREQDGKVKVVGINETDKAISFNVEYGYTAFDGSSRDTRNAELTLSAYSRKTVLEFEKGSYDLTKGCIFVKPAEGTKVLPAVLRVHSFRNLNVPKPEVELFDFNISGGKAVFKVKSSTYAHAVHFSLCDNIKLSDEYFDLLPGETREVVVENVPEGLTKEDISLKVVSQDK